MGGTPIAGWFFVRENAMNRWMMTEATPMAIGELIEMYVLRP